MANKLILRSKNSPFTGQFVDINLGSVLSHANVDDNFITLKGNLIWTATTDSSNVILHKIDGSTITFPFSGGSGGGTGDTYVIDGLLSGTTLILERNDAVNVPIDLSGLPGVSGSTYTNSAATPTTIGGISAGSTFSDETMQEMWDMLLYPYQYPAFTTFTRGTMNSVYELGESLVGGAQVFTWATSNSGNVSASTVDIYEDTTATALMTNGPDDGTEALGTTSFSLTAAGTTLLYTITADNTLGDTFSSTISRSWRGRWYYGMDASTSVVESDITGFTTELTTSVVNDYITWTPSGAQYGYLVIPDYLAQPSDLRDSVAGCFGTNIPFITGGTITFDNDFGVSQTYNIYRTVNAFNSPVDAWLCS